MGQEFDDEGVICGDGDPENADQAAAIEDSFSDSLTKEFIGSFSGHFKLLTAAQQVVASSVFGTGLDVSGVYLSDFTGVENRPFTLAFALPAVLSLELGVSSVYLINCGTFNPGTPLLIHELTHVWQSQHHLNPFQYIQNSIDSQVQAVAFNLSVGSTDPRFPFSPYAYIPGKAFSEYAAEQIAKQVERGESAIVQHVANIGAFAEDPENETGLAAARCENKTGTGVQF